MELDVGTGMSSFIWLVSTESDFSREEGTRLIVYQNAALDNGGGRLDKYTGAEGFIGLKVKVVDETVAVEIVLRWGGGNIAGSGVFVL